MATPVYIDKNFANKLSKFTQDKELNPDNFRVFKDVTAKQQSSLSRLKLLLEKTSLNESEKQEVSELQIELRDCMPTSEDWNMLQSSIYNIQCYMRDGIVIFVKQKQEEINEFVEEKVEVIINLISQYGYMGEWSETKPYKMGNMVKCEGYGYICIQDNTGRKPILNEDSSCWACFTLKGDKGDPSLNVNCKGVYNLNTTYNIGDACIYDNHLYYNYKQDGIKGIIPTNGEYWSTTDKIVVNNMAPVDTSLIWWDSNSTQNCLKIYKNNKRDYVRLNGFSADGSLDTDEKNNLVEAINELYGDIRGFNTDIIKCGSGVIVEEDTLTDCLNNIEENKQDKVDDNLRTYYKDIVEAINHIYFNGGSQPNIEFQNRDDDGIATTLVFTDENGTLLKTSILSSKNSDGDYTKRTISYYKNGSVIYSEKFKLIYDSNGYLEKEVRE